MPDWLIEQLRQFPVVGLAGVVAWYAYREVKRNNTAHREQEQKAHADAVNRLEQAHANLLAAKDGEIARLTKEHKAELRKLTKTVQELVERMKP
jgi:flagellar biosynthesis/type III secretory pathway M-ring protein FliF/YscJ